MTAHPVPAVALLTFPSGETVPCSSAVGAKPCEGVQAGEPGLYCGVLLSGMTPEGTGLVRTAARKGEPFTLSCAGNVLEWRIEPARGEPVHALGHVCVMPETFARLVRR